MGWKLATDCSHSDIILTVTALASIIQLVWLSTIRVMAGIWLYPYTHLHMHVAVYIIFAGSPDTSSASIGGAPYNVSKFETHL